MYQTVLKDLTLEEIEEGFRYVYICDIPIKVYRNGDVKVPFYVRCDNYYDTNIYVSPKFNLTNADTNKAYLNFSFKSKSLYVHQLVCFAFCLFTGLNPDGRPIVGKAEVNHKDGNSLNNSADNLEWCDRYYNNQQRLLTEKWKDYLYNSRPRKKVKKS